MLMKMNFKDSQSQLVRAAFNPPTTTNSTAPLLLLRHIDYSSGIHPLSSNYP